MATHRQLVEAELVDEFDHPLPPWHPIQGPSDASTMWYAVMRKRTRGFSALDSWPFHLHGIRSR